MASMLTRIEVTGGFLHDLDIEFVPGLNVIIGPRGAGKTSVLELLRYAFGVHAITPEAEQRARAHALDVLVDGSVAVTVTDDGNDVTFSRDGHSEGETAPGASVTLRPLIVSQQEIEDIGLNARSRVHILDGLVPHQEGSARRGGCAARGVPNRGRGLSP
jgi:AAA domain